MNKYCGWETELQTDWTNQPSHFHVYTSDRGLWKFAGRLPFDEDAIESRIERLEKLGNRVRVVLFFKKTRERLVWHVTSTPSLMS